MANFDLNNVDGMQFDVLRELGNIGAGNATTALSSMLNTKVDMNVPKVDLLSFEELHEIMGGAETIVVGILVTLDEDINGMMMFMMKTKSAFGLVDILFGRLQLRMQNLTKCPYLHLRSWGTLFQVHIYHRCHL